MGVFISEDFPVLLPNLIRMVFLLFVFILVLVFMSIGVIINRYLYFICSSSYYRLIQKYYNQ